MSIAREDVDGVVVLTPEEKLDVSTAPELRDALEQAFEEGGRDVLIDLGNVRFISSAGLSALLRGAQLAESSGGRCVLSALDGVALEAYRISGLERVLGVFPSRKSALVSFAYSAKAAPGSGARDLDTGLSMPEELLLLALDDEGQLIELPEHALDHALAGAVLMDLCARGRIDSDLELLTVADVRPVGDPILDPALAGIACVPERRSAEAWVSSLAQEGEAIRHRAVERLVDRGILERKATVLHWVVGGRRYPVVDGTEQREIRERVLAILTRGETPGPREVAIIALAEACAVFDGLIGMEEMVNVRPRIEEVARMDLVAQAMQRALVTAQTSGASEGPAGMYGTADGAS